jgi:hypothetical protein
MKEDQMIQVAKWIGEVIFEIKDFVFVENKNERNILYDKFKIFINKNEKLKKIK